jgi:hypothetical protein
MNFEKLEEKYDKCPIVLIDRSGSTSSEMIRVDVIDDTSISVLDFEVKQATDILMEKKISKCYLGFWNSSVTWASQEPVDVYTMVSYKPSSSGGTTLQPALNSINDSWLYNKQVSEIYIFTDGEISDSGYSLADTIKKLFQKNVKIQIVTVEPNYNNYLESNCDAGNQLYKILKSESLMGRVKKFISYNQYHLDTPFVSFDNPEIGPGYAPFEGKVFRIDKVADFVTYLSEHIQNKNNNELLKIAHELTMTLYHLTKDRSMIIQRKIIEMFCELFSDTVLYRDIRKMFLQEIDNHSKGKSTTFQGYKNNREKVFEKSQLALYENVKDNISFVPNDEYMSFIVNTEEGNYIFKASETNMSEKIMLSDKTYNNSGTKIGKFHLPMLPMKVKMDHDFYDQCVRQWIRANYAKKYRLNPASDFILYYFFADVLRVMLSDVSSEIKEGWKQLAFLNLDRKRFGTDITEYDYLLHNPPAPVTGSEEKINYIFNRCVYHLTKDSEVKIQPMTFWFAFIKCLGDEQLTKTQLVFSSEDLVKDNVDQETVFELIKKHMVPIKQYSYSSNTRNLEYTCYITWENTSQVGGYVLPAHQLGKIKCSPNFVLTEDAFNAIKTSDFKCPICNKQLDSLLASKVPNEKEYLESLNKDETNKLPTVTEKYYDSTNFELVNIPEDMYLKDDDQTLKKMDDCNFETVAFQINKPYIQEAIGSRSIEVRTQEEFNSSVGHRYSFLNELDFTGACLAGGFCRSILLRQRLKDLDFFLYWDEHEKNFSRLLKQVLEVLKKNDDKLKFLMMYKHLFNVFEVVAVHDPNDFFGDDYVLDNFKQYDFKSLHRFDQHTIIDPETGKVYKKKGKYRTTEVDKTEQDIENRDFSNYFEDGDVSGVRMKHRIQFILTKNKNIGEIFSNFDFYPCRVAWDGKTTWFTDKSEFAYKYMVNVVNENNYSTLFDHRLSKYFSYGFSPVLPLLDIKKVYGNSNLNINDVSFKVISTMDNCIMVEHNSHIEDKLKSIEKLEKKNLENGKSLYKSSLFCSLVSLLRYVKINDISYRFSAEVTVPDESGFMKFRETEETVKFIEKIDSRISGTNWYGYYRKPAEKKEDNISI